MRISAVIPTYNRREYVIRAVDSVLAQTVSVEEIIIVDDGSTDGTCETIRARYGSGVSVIRQENAGVSAARNLGVQNARAAWVAFLDSDDTWSPTKIERQCKVLTALGDGFGLCFTDCILHGDPAMKPTVFQDSGFSPFTTFGELNHPAEYLLGPPSPYRMQSLMVLRSLLLGINGFDEGLKVMEDLDVLFRLTFKTRFAFVAEPLVQIDRSPSRPHGLCEIFATRSDRKYDDLRRVYQNWLRMPEVLQTDYEWRISQLLKVLSYDSLENKMHRFRVGPAVREMSALNQLGDSYGSIILNLYSRKMRKLRSVWRRPEK